MKISELTPSESRLKRQVWGPSHRIQVLSPREFAGETGAELDSLGLGGFASFDKGWEGEGRFSDVYRLNLSLATASRVLLKVGEFRAGAREQLFGEVRKFPWELWVPSWAVETGLDLRVQLEASRVHHEGAAARAVEEAVLGRLRIAGASTTEGVAPNTGQRPRIYLRGSGARVELSLDSSGEHLHRRGFRLDPGPAPVAEHLAAGLLARLASVFPNPDWVVDGMTGSGTLAIEAYIRLGGILPGRLRRFGFQDWPSFRENHLEYLKRAEHGRDSKEPVPILAVDKSSRSLRAVEANVLRAGAEIEVRNADFFGLSQDALGLAGSGWVVLNPPYDLRLDSDQDSLWNGISRSLCRKWRGAAMVIVPHRRLLRLFEDVPRVAENLDFSHGGKAVTAVFLKLTAQV